ncbi:MAG: RHS repeat-associated core domain-containing protein [Enterobacterales bacterium]|nr:RHS repeat-associated core domain-containing protein [Enterobacterales bacterium]
MTLANGKGIRHYHYDNNGNLTNDGSRSIIYNAYNKPSLITVSANQRLNPFDTLTSSANTSRFYYGADQLRYKQVKTINGVETTTIYIGKHFEQITQNGQVTKKAYVGDIAVVIQIAGTTNEQVRYLHRDRLGSMIGSFDEQGNLLQHHSYDPFGKPRDGRLRDNFTDVLTGITIPQNILGSETTNRGFTDHEHLDDAQLIHMNGRVYDYNLGRFLSVDPFIQAPGNSQSMNPYSYIMNNPLAGTDPSGYAADIDQDKLEVKVTSQSRTRSAPTGSRIKRDTSRTITATVTDESGKSSNYVYTVARNGSERAFKITPITLKPDNTDLGSKGQVDVGTNLTTGKKDGTYFFGGAGMNGDYVDDMVEQLEGAGISDVHAVNTDEWSGGSAADAAIGVLALNEEVDVSDKITTMREKFEGKGDGEGQLNLVGYSYGSLVAAHVAMTRVQKGGTVDNLVLIGSPITSEFLNTLRNTPGIKNVLVRDLTSRGDPIRAGMSGLSVALSAPKLFYQQMTGTGHFYYAGGDKVSQGRRRELANDLYKSGLR